MRVGVAGLGLMGSGIAARLLAKGHDLSVYNRSKEKAEQFSKARVAASPKELASTCNLVITVVTDFAAVHEVLLGQDGVIQSDSSSLIVADASTISPSQSSECAQALRNTGIEMLGMPVMGGPAAAESGDLVPMVAGSRQAFEKALPVIEKLGTPFYIGSRDGAANAMKLALNLNIALIASAVSEGITLVRGSGIDPSIFIHILNSTYFKTGLSEKKGPKMVSGDFTPQARLSQHIKDVRLMIAEASRGGNTLPLTATHLQLLELAEATGLGDHDNSAIIKAIETHAFRSALNNR